MPTGNVPRYQSKYWWLLVRYRKKRLAELMPDGKVTSHFRYIEFYTKDGTPFPVKALPGLRAHCERFLEPMREEFGPCYILSGYRHEKYNRQIGGVANSRHIWDRYPTSTATDVMFRDSDVFDWAGVAREIRRKTGGTGGIGIYPTKGFLHLDSREYKADWSGR